MLLLVFVPIVLGLFSYALAQMVYNRSPFLYTTSLGILGVVFGASIPEPSLLVFASIVACVHFHAPLSPAANSRRSSSIR